MAMAQEVLTVQEVAALLRVSRDTVYRLAARGGIPGRKIGRVWRFPKDAIQGYLAEGKRLETESWPDSLIRG